MSRAKAVEAAMREIWDGAPLKGPTPKGCRSALERLADEMRIEGMREAARVKTPGREEIGDNPASYGEMGYVQGHDAHAEAIRARARELARKTKGGRGCVSE